MDKNYWLLKTPIAHRGLWQDGIIENSLPAYSNAIKKGFPIEIDIYCSSDGVPYCFHDKSLLRLTGVNGSLYEKTSKKLNYLFLLGSREKIPTLESVLKLVNGRIPLLIEIKNQPGKHVVERIMNCLKDYKGEYAIQSFNPLFVKKAKKLAPNINCGILTTKKEDDLEGQGIFKKLLVKHMLLNWLVKPDFISIEKNSVDKKFNLPTLVWTITGKTQTKQIKRGDNYIFEGFTPRLIYTEENTDIKFLKTPATCVAKAVYYYSSKSGKAGEETFEYGDFGEHNFVNGYCTVCGEKRVSQGLTYNLINNDTEYEVSGIGICADSELIIPNKHNGLPVTSIGEKAFYERSSITSVEIGDNITNIGAGAFCMCSEIKTIEIKEKVATIGDMAFSYCDSLLSINTEENNANYKSVDGNLYSKDGKTLIQYAIGKTATEFSVPKEVKNIATGAFYGCNSLESITMGDKKVII